MKVQASSLSHRSLGLTRIVAFSVLSIVLAFGCGNDGSNGTNGGGATGGNGTAPFSGAVLCSIAATPEGSAGFMRLVPDGELEAAEEGEQIDALEGAIEFAGGVSCAVKDRSVFALNFESPTITRYDEVDGALVEGPTVSFANFGLTSLASSLPPLVFLSNAKAYYLDAASSQILIWNPEAMETIGSIPLTVADPPEGLRQGGLRVNLIGGQAVAYSSYVNEQDIGVARADFWFVDPNSDEVVATDVTEQCGGLQQNVATATNGDTYIGMSALPAMEHALGLPGSYPPCAIRIRAGTREVDTSYLADLNALTGGLPTGQLISVGNDRALMLAYDTNIPIDPMLTGRELQTLPNWNFYEWELGTEQPATLVESLPTGTAAVATREFEGRAFLARISPDVSSTELLDLTRRPVEVTFTLSNVTILLARLGSEPDARMAQRIEPRGGLSILSVSDFGN